MKDLKGYVIGICLGVIITTFIPTDTDYLKLPILFNTISILLLTFSIIHKETKEKQ